MIKEIFKQIPGYEDYVVSDLGTIKSLKSGRKRILKGGIGSGGYRQIMVKRSYPSFHSTRYTVGHLILLAFVGPCPIGKETSHLNGNKLDDRLENLAWESHSENNQRTDSRGEGNGNSYLTKEDVFKIKELLKQRYKQGYIAGMFNTTTQNISKIKYGVTWSHV